MPTTAEPKQELMLLMCLHDENSNVRLRRVWSARHSFYIHTNARMHNNAATVIKGRKKIYNDLAEEYSQSSAANNRRARWL